MLLAALCIDGRGGAGWWWCWGARDDEEEADDDDDDGGVLTDCDGALRGAAVVAGGMLTEA